MDALQVGGNTRKVSPARTAPRQQRVAASNRAERARREQRTHALLHGGGGHGSEAPAGRRGRPMARGRQREAATGGRSSDPRRHKSLPPLSTAGVGAGAAGAGCRQQRSVSKSPTPSRRTAFPALGSGPSGAASPSGSASPLTASSLSSHSFSLQKPLAPRPRHPPVSAVRQPISHSKTSPARTEGAVAPSKAATIAADPTAATRTEEQHQEPPLRRPLNPILQRASCAAGPGSSPRPGLAGERVLGRSLDYRSSVASIPGARQSVQLEIETKGCAVPMPFHKREQPRRPTVSDAPKRLRGTTLRRPRSPPTELEMHGGGEGEEGYDAEVVRQIAFERGKASVKGRKRFQWLRRPIFLPVDDSVEEEKDESALPKRASSELRKLYSLVSQQQMEIYTYMFERLDGQRKGSVALANVQNLISDESTNEAITGLMNTFGITTSTVLSQAEFVALQSIKDRVYAASRWRRYAKGDDQAGLRKKLGVNLSRIEALVDFLPRVQQVYRMFDLNEDGLVDFDALLLMLSAAHGRVDHDLAHEVLGRIDSDGDGLFTVVDFLQFVPFFLSLHDSIVKGDPLADLF